MIERTADASSGPIVSSVSGRAAQPARVEVGAQPAGHDDPGQVAMAGQALVQPEQPLLEPAEPRDCRLEADPGADVARGRRRGCRDARARRAGPGPTARAAGSTRAGQLFDRLRVRQRVGDRADAAGALHDRQRRGERAALDQLLEPAMHEEEPGVEVEDALADRREAEVAGLDDAGVDRADRELVDALAVDLERDEVALGVGWPDARRDVLAERVVAAAASARGGPSRRGSG